MKYKITHTTTYEYSETVAICQNEAHLAPRSGDGQSCDYHRLVIHPAPSSTAKRMDYFGNQVNLFAITSGHRKLRVTAVSRVDVHPRELPVAGASPAWEAVRDALPADTRREGLDTYQFTFDSRHVVAAAELAEYARPSFTPNRRLLEATVDLTARIHKDFTYDPTATTVATPVSEVFRNRRGVCQDLAHLQIACLRSLRLPARYVSGYLRTHPPEGKPRLVGADASHAWLSVFCGPLGWVDVDPTNNVLPSADHITVAWGRDYADVCPINGMYVGGGQHTMSVGVDVQPL